jgi:hypothetical protein
VKGYHVPLHFIVSFDHIERQVSKMEIAVNTSLRPYNFSFYIKGRLVTVQLLPGASRVKKEYLPELRKIRMFATLEDDSVINVGVKEPKDTMDAIEIGKPAEAPAKKSSKKAPAKKSGTMDLEDL